MSIAAIDFFVLIFVTCPQVYGFSKFAAISDAILNIVQGIVYMKLCNWQSYDLFSIIMAIQVGKDIWIIITTSSYQEVENMDYSDESFAIMGNNIKMYFYLWLSGDILNAVLFPIIFTTPDSPFLTTGFQIAQITVMWCTTTNQFNTLLQYNSKSTEYKNSHPIIQSKGDLISMVHLISFQAVTFIFFLVIACAYLHVGGHPTTETFFCVLMVIGFSVCSVVNSALAVTIICSGFCLFFKLPPYVCKAKQQPATADGVSTSDISTSDIELSEVYEMVDLVVSKS